MEALNQTILVGGLILLVALLLGAASSRVGLPFLLVFLVVGMLAGEDGPGRIAFNDYRLSFLVGNIALAVILLDGGLRTRFATFRVGLRPALVLATVGVAMTAALLGVCAALVFGLDWRLAGLLGAIVGSTDAAAVFALLKSAGVRLGDRISATLEIESGANDPMAVFLTIALIDVVLSPAGQPLAQLAFELARQFGIGIAAGLAFGFVSGRGLPRIRLGAGLDAVLVCAVGISVFALTNALGGSGFLAVYLTGLLIANAPRHASDDVLRAMDSMAWLAQSVMFLLLGLLVTPHELPPVLAPAFGVAAFLMLVARPAMVWICLAPFRFPAAEVWYIGWMGLRGAVPIVLAIFPLLAGVPQADLLFNVAFVVVLVSLLAQGTTVGPAARALGIALPPRRDPLARTQLARGGGRHELVEFAVPASAPVCGAPLDLVDLPRGARAIAVMRSAKLLEPAAAGPLEAGDVVAVIAPETAVERLEDIFLADAAIATAGRHRSFGEFFIDADARAAEVLAVYGVPLPAYLKVDGTIGELVRSRLKGHPVEGDAVTLSGIVVTVAEMDGDRISRVALRLPRAPARRK
jgi:cell volume regulation protein A